MSKIYCLSIPEFTGRAAYDANSNLQYYGEAMPGSATSAAVWRIKKLTYDSSNNLLSILWADGDDQMDNIWDNYASLTYS